MTEPASDKQIAYVERFISGERPAPKGWREHYESIIAAQKGKSVKRIVDVPVEDIAALIARIRQAEARIKVMDEALAWYADQSCEHSKDFEGCGKLTDFDCSGCRARAARKETSDACEMKLAAPDINKVDWFCDKCKAHFGGFRTKPDCKRKAST